MKINNTIENNKTKMNVVFALMLQFATIVSGFIVPKMILKTFGSEVNGLINSITQFLNYISLFEGGIGSVIMASLYKPFSDNDNKKLSAVINASINFFRKLSLIFIGYTIVVSILYPLLFSKGYDFKFVSSLTLILAINLFMQYNFSITWRIMLKADKRVYVSASIDALVIILYTLFTVLAIHIYPEVHFVKLCSAFVYVLQPVVYNHYVKSKYNIDRTEAESKEALDQRWDGFGINVAAFLNSNTDVIVLTILSNLINVSIYSVYSLVTLGISNLIKAISSGVNPSIGNAYAKDDEKELNDIFSKYENIIFYLTMSIYSVAIIMIVPFVMVYTKGISDANYNQRFFSILMIMSAAMFCLREPYVNMAYIAKKFREISKYAYIESAINVIFSIIFVTLWGLNGVAMGTLCSMTFRTVFHILYLRNKIIFRSPVIPLIKFILLLFSSFIGVEICKYFVNTSNVDGWLKWIEKAAVCSFVIFIINACSLFTFKFMKKQR